MAAAKTSQRKGLRKYQLKTRYNKKTPDWPPASLWPLRRAPSPKTQISETQSFKSAIYRKTLQPAATSRTPRPAQPVRRPQKWRPHRPSCQSWKPRPKFSSRSPSWPSFRRQVAIRGSWGLRAYKKAILKSRRTLREWLGARLKSRSSRV